MMRFTGILLLAGVATAMSARLQAEAPRAFPLFDGHVRAMAISPDGGTLAVGDDDGEMVLWDVAAQQIARKLKKHAAGVRAFQFTPDGKTLISGSADGDLRIWSSETGELLRSVKTIGRIEDVCLSPDGKRLAVSFSEGSEAQIFDPEAGKEVRRLKLPYNEPLKGSNCREAVSFSPDGTLLAVSSGGRAWPNFMGGDSTISLWNAADWTMRASFTGDRFTMYDLEFSPDGKWLAGATNRGKTVKLWEVPAAAAAPKVEHSAKTIAALVKQLDSDGFRERQSAQRKLIEVGHAAKGALRKAAQSDAAEVAFRAKAILKELSHAELQPKRILPGSPFDTHAITFSPDGKWLASGRQSDNPGNVILDELGDAPRRVVAPHRHGAWTVEFSADGKQLITGRRDGQITLWVIQP